MTTRVGGGEGGTDSGPLSGKPVPPAPLLQSMDEDGGRRFTDDDRKQSTHDLKGTDSVDKTDNT